MIPLTVAEIATVVGGSVHGDPSRVVTGDAFIDSRAPVAGGLFVAVEGEHVDGHAFADQTLADGAAAVLGKRPAAGPTVVVDDPVLALGRLAKHVRDRLPKLTVLALTGSQGKTGTKDFLAQLLEAHAATVATRGNLNNEIGVPLTVLRADEETRYLVVEMGARGIGHIAYLCDVARPTVAAVLNVGTAHMSEFGSRAAIATAKGEIVESLPPQGTAVLNLDDQLVVEMAHRTVASVLGFGGSTPDAVTWSGVSTDELERVSATLHYQGASETIRLLEIGEHQLLNAAAAVAMALAAGLSFAAAAQALVSVRSRSRWRMEVHDVAMPAGDVTVINDAYNANPASMTAALQTLGRIGARREAGRTIAVIGEMLELGADSGKEHRQLGMTAAQQDIDLVLAVGEPADLIVESASSVTSWSGSAMPVADAVAALAWLRENLAAGDVVLVKASRAAALERVAEGLTNKETAP